MNFKKLFVCIVVVMGMLSGSVNSVLAAPAPTAVMKPEAKATLLIKLINQLKVLQAELALLQAAEAKTQIIPLPVAEADYTRGPATAHIKIVTFTDFDCPFCKLFHETLDTIFTKYPDVSVSYRHFPLEQLHPNSKKLSIAAECAGTIGGDVAFWKFVDSAFDSRGVNETTNMLQVNTFASAAGVPLSAFESCRTSKSAEALVMADIKDGTDADVMGTPQSFVFRDGIKVATLSGAQPLAVVEEIIKNLQK